METRQRPGSSISLVFGIAILMSVWMGTAQGAEPRAQGQAVTEGRRVYEANCAICHGVAGDGRGMAAHMFATPPRDFTQGIFKFRSTPNGSLPTDSDLVRTITEGLRGTPMAPQRQFTRPQLEAVVGYVKTFSERFSRETRRSPAEIPVFPASDEGPLERGRELYVEAGCGSCHGANGRGDGPSAGDLVDAWGQAIRPGDLATPAKRGASVSSTYLSLVTGLDGTPMPSYRDALSDEQLWALAFYVSSLDKGSLSAGQRQEEMRGQHVLMMHGPRRGMMHGPLRRMR